MKHFFTGFMIFLVIAVLTGCTHPVGNIDRDGNGNGNGNGTGDLNFMYLVPHRLLYETDQWFIPIEDLQIIYVENGLMRELPPYTPGVEIDVLLNAHNVDNPPAIPVMPNSTEYKLITPGRHQIRVTYNEKSSRYTIEVRGTYSGGGDESDFLGSTWL